ncbi:MAG: phage shock protein operon transcriptional activator [Pseudomonadota bacterium]
MNAPAATRNPIIGEAPAFVGMLEQVSRAARLSKPVLVIGERGTGKELVSSRLHFLSPRWEQPLVKINCAALTWNILESELFGHEAGAFTGATRQHIGCFERADGGTLFLDELATLPLRTQEKILRVIEYGEFERVGGSKTLQVDVRLVGATNADLPERVRKGDFRPDLLDRLAFDVVQVPPLRARREDILTLANHFAVAITSELGHSFFPGFSPEAQAELLEYSWPGNVRELKNVVERSVYRSEEPDEPVSALHLNPFAARYEALPSHERVIRNAPALPVARLRPAKRGPTSLKDAVRDLEVSLVTEALEASRFHQRKAAEYLGLSYHQLRALVRKYELNKLAG